MKRLIQMLAEKLLNDAVGDAYTLGYLKGLETGRQERPMTCGLAQRDHCSHSYIYDPGQ